MPRYAITHLTRYEHTAPATTAWQAVHLQPRQETNQAISRFALEVTPHCGDLAIRTDAFGNALHVFTVRAVHRRLEIISRSVVERTAPSWPIDAHTLVVGAARHLARAAIASGSAFELDHFLHPSPLVPFVPEARDLAAEGDAVTILAWLRETGSTFAREFTFDASATNVSTPLKDVLRHRRGVCQDFAHLLISCLRQHGLPTAYVSGYLLTEPPPGQPRLIGADASHAWISVFVPGIGWVDYDPTNNCFVGDAHIVVARGRDYTDVCPVKGVFSGGGEHALHTGVTVEPAPTPEAEMPDGPINDPR
jgi:transglutaminase-like putative cysteine protease